MYLVAYNIQALFFFHIHIRKPDYPGFSKLHAVHVYHRNLKISSQLKKNVTEHYILMNFG